MMINGQEFEAARLELQVKLDGAKTQAERNRLGQFATPSDLAFEIMSYALSFLPAHSKIRFLEPGFGTGPFYSALLRHGVQIEIATGYEIDRHYARPSSALWKKQGLRLRNDDFALAAPPKTDSAKYNLVVCNPPYVRHHHLGQTQKHQLQAAVARYTNIEMNGLSGLYAYFLLLSQAWMLEQGVGAWLIPSEFMDVKYGRKVKQFLLERVTLHRIHRFDPNEVQFGDALVSSAVVFFTNASPRDGHHAEFSFGGSLSAPKLSCAIGLDELQQVTKWTSLPRSPLAPKRQRPSSTLGDLFTIKRGIATGSNSFFVLTPEQVQQLGLPDQFRKPILPSPRHLTSDEILATANGEPAIDKRRYLLSCDLPEHEVRLKYPSLWQYLERGIQERVHENYICRHRQPWYMQEQRPPAPFLCTYMGRTTGADRSPFRFILNHSQATVANVYLLLYPKPALKTLLNNNADLYRIVWKALSSITAEMLMGEGRVYGGGLHKLEPKELANVPGDVVLNALPSGTDLNRQLKLFSI